MRFRQRVTVKSNNNVRGHIYPLAYDEVFVNLNRVDWVDTKTFNQNRVFLGGEIPFDNIQIQIGYINQFILQRQPENQMNHILWLALQFAPR